MKKILKVVALLLIIFIVSGCATREKINSSSRLADGIWVGTMNFESTKKNSEKSQLSHDLLIASCKGSIRVWISKEKNGSYEMINEKYSIQSYPDTHLIYFLDADPRQPDWVEIQSYLLMEIDADNAVVQYGRVINNRDLDPLNEKRYFANQGVANLRRAGSNCDSRFNP